MENTTTPKISQQGRSKFIRPSPSSSFRSPLIKTADKKIAFEFENASLEEKGRRLHLKCGRKMKILKKKLVY
ncbi:hypothetical protein CEXT_284061 [Caerostris extrusa]|uniref:Uncharacterized protein n=1 Tax=Caerostris extrusa TaxID=172846 RepID=A0AAV4PMG8_CAEEX|nr:hypothetical protein CEXT_284061 [Caerostris extrusa]